MALLHAEYRDDMDVEPLRAEEGFSGVFFRKLSPWTKNDTPNPIRCQFNHCRHSAGYLEPLHFGSRTLYVQV